MAELKAATMINSRCAPPRMLLLLVLVASARLCDAIEFLTSTWDVRAGEKFHLAWANQITYATINLMKGSPQVSDTTFKKLIISNTHDLQYDWLVPDDLPEDDYFLWINDDAGAGRSNYSPTFRIQASNLTTSSITPAATATSSQPSGTSTSTSPDSAPGSNPGLSSGALAGIGIGVAIIIILMIGGVGYFFYHRGKAVGAKGARLRDDDEGQNDAHYYKETKPTSIYEMDANPEPMEMAVREQCTVEMPAPAQVLELESLRWGVDRRSLGGGHFVSPESPRFGVDKKSFGGEESVSPESPRVEVGRKGFGKMDLESRYKA